MVIKLAMNVEVHHNIYKVLIYWMVAIVEFFQFRVVVFQDRVRITIQTGNGRHISINNGFFCIFHKELVIVIVYRLFIL